jgi:glycosyltransferase involved in cell wall biosynthesis
MRILIDCSYINFQAQPSGVPRVVASYVEAGYRWGETRNIEVIPVVPKAGGLYLVRPVPGLAPPVYLRDAMVVGTSERTIKFFGGAAYLAGRFARSVARHVLHRGATLFGRRNSSVFYRLDESLTGLARRTFLLARDMAPNRHQVVPTQGDILFCPAYWHDVDPGIYRRIRAQGCAIVILVHDLLPITMPEQYAYPWREDFKKNLIQAFDHASAFVCVSETTRQALRTFAREVGKDGNFATAHNGYQAVGTSTPTSRTHRLDVLFKSALAPLLMVGSIEPKKGHVRVLEELERKWSSGYDRPLAIAGRPGWMASDIVQRIRHSLYFGKKLFWFEDFDDDDLSFAYSRCHALVFASLAEGFGLPLIEAAMDRKPAIVYRTEIAEEILGDYGVFFDDSPNALSTALDALEQPQTYARVRERLSTFNWPGWPQRVAAVFDSFIACQGDWTTLPEIIAPANRGHGDPDAVRRAGAFGTISQSLEDTRQ